MKLLLLTILLSAGSAFAWCPNDQNYAICVKQEEIQKQLDQLKKVQQMNAYQQTQPKEIRQQCYQNVFGVIECK